MELRSGLLCIVVVNAAWVRTPQSSVAFSSPSENLKISRKFRFLASETLLGPRPSLYSTSRVPWSVVPPPLHRPYRRCEGIDGAFVPFFKRQWLPMRDSLLRLSCTRACCEDARTGRYTRADEREASSREEPPLKKRSSIDRFPKKSLHLRPPNHLRPRLPRV